MLVYSYEFVCRARKGEILHLAYGRTSDVADSRNYLARTMMGEFILMLDVDHCFEPDLLARMLALFNSPSPDGDRVDVLSGFYRYRSYPYLPCAFHWDEAAQQHAVIGQLSWNAPMVKVGCTGAGCLLIRRSVFDRIRDELHEEPFTRIPPIGEDFAFGRRIAKLGIKWWLSPQIKCDHLTTKRISDADYDPSVVELVPAPSGGVAIGEVRK
jgi:GT2 family glycosyltransferase